MTTLTISRIPRIVDDAKAMQQLRDGLGNAVYALRVDEIEQAYRLHGLDDDKLDPPGIEDWDRDVTDAVIAEVAPAVATLLQAALDKRLPWSSSVPA